MGEKLKITNMKKILLFATAVFVLMVGATPAQAVAPPVITRVISNTSATAIANGTGSPYAIGVGHSPTNLRAYFYLRVDGSNFSNAAKIWFGNTLLTPYSRTNNRLMATVRYTSIASPGNRSIMVVNSPSTNSNMSNGFVFEVVRRKPFISSIFQSSTRVNRMPDGDIITISGEGIRNDSQDRLRGENRDTEFFTVAEFNEATQSVVIVSKLRMTLEENDVSEIGHASVSVYNPDGPNNPFPKGTSHPASFRIGP